MAGVCHNNRAGSRKQQLYQRVFDKICEERGKVRHGSLRQAEGKVDLNLNID